LKENIIKNKMVNNRQKDYEPQMLGKNGCLIITDTNAHTGRFYSIVVASDTVINAILQQPVDSSSAAAAKTDAASASVGAGLLITPGIGSGKEYVFTSITLTSGSVIAYYA
jgi:hypothetical protein